MRGFTLLELLISMAIFALAGVSVMKATTEHMSYISILEETSIATWVAENRLAELQLAKSWPPENNKKQKINMSNRDWTWKQEVVKTEDKDLRQVTILVYQGEQLKDSVYQLTTFLGNKK